MKKLLFLDLETTGLDVRTCGVYQVGWCVEANGGREWGAYYVKPANGAQYDGDALQLAVDTHGLTVETMEGFDTAHTVVKDHLVPVVEAAVDRRSPRDRLWVVGWNAAAFDYPVFRR